MKPSKPLLLIEDDQIDARTLKRALQDIGVSDTIIHLTHGGEALDYLKSGVNDQPSLILLDLNMPQMNGHEFLQAVKEDPVLCCIPVVVLTTSTDDCDVAKTFAESAAGYMVKPLDYAQFVGTIKAIEDYWSMSMLPSQVASAQ